MNKVNFEELIEKVFSMGYEYALEELEEQKMFSEDEDDDDDDDDEKPSKKIRLRDRMDIWAYKNLFGKKSRKRQIKELDEKESISRVAVNNAKRHGKRGAIAGAIGGAALEILKSDEDNRVKDALVGAASGAITGGIASGAGSAIGSAVGTMHRRSLRKISKGYDKAMRKEQDKMKVADGQMSREEFAKKWGK